MLACFVFVLLVTGCITAWVLLHRPGDARRPRYYATLALEHVALALQALAGFALLAQVTASLAAVAGVLLFAWVGADAVVYSYAGLRMQWQLLKAVRELPTLAARFAWKRVVGSLVGGSIVLGLLVRALAQPLVHVGWPLSVLVAMAGMSAAVMTESLRRGLPMEAAFDWNLRVIARQAAWLTRGLSGRSETSSPAPDDEDPMARTKAQQSVAPRPFVPHLDVATSPDPTRPLMRHTAGFSGPKHFDVRIDAGEKPHVVIIFMESVRAADVGILGAKHGPVSLTPCFDALAAEGVLWNNFYGNGTITALALSAALYGIPPPFLQRTHTDSGFEATMLGMPHIFADHGYLPAFFCDGPLDWENKRQFLMHNGFRLFYGAPSIKATYPEAPESVWHFHDEYLMRFHAEWLARQDARAVPTFSSLLTVTNHYPWQPPPNAPVIDVPMDPESLQYRYLRCTAYTDRCLGQYMDDMRKRGLDKNTIFLIMGDHSQQVSNPNDVWWSGRCTTDGVRIPCLMYAPGRLQPAAIDEVASQTDLLPTLLDVFGFEASHHAVGTTMRRQCAERSALTVHPWIPGMASTRQGPFRHTYTFESRRAGLYSAQTDPNSTQDVTPAHAALAAERFAEAEQMRDILNTLYQEDRIATAPGTAYLRGRLLLDAPKHFPTTIEACRERLSALQKMRTERTRIDATETTVMMIALNTTGLTDDERVEYAQLMLARVHIATVGELTDAEDARLVEIDKKAAYPESMPAWERSMMESMRHIAQEKPYPFFRTAKPGDR